MAGQEPVTDNKSQIHYNHQSPLQDDDLVDMNEIIQCNLQNWNICTEQTEIAQEIKLESYNFLGNEIDYHDKDFKFTSLPLPDHYFNDDNAHNYESEDEDAERSQRLNGVINLIDDCSDDDDVVNLLNSSSEQETPNNTAPVCPNLESIRSDHNYSSQEVIVTPNSSQDVKDTFEIDVKQELEPTVECHPEKVETTDNANDMQSLIANLINNTTTANKISILNELEIELKRVKSTISEVSQEEPPILDADIPNGHDARPSADASDSSQENDSMYIMSEGHSEPLEYRKISSTQETEDEDGACAAVTEAKGVTENLKEPNLVQEMEESNREQEVNEADPNQEMNEADLNQEMNEADPNQEMNEADPNQEMNEADQEIREAYPNQEIKETDPNQEISADVNTTVESKSDVEISVDNAHLVIERISSKLTSFSKLFASGETSDESLKNELTDLSTTSAELVQSIKAIYQVFSKKKQETVDDNVVAEDKASKLNDKSKQRWLASSSEDDVNSEESSPESVTVKRRKKRARTISTSDEEIGIKTARKKNVLLESSDDERSMESDKESIEMALSSTLKDTSLLEVVKEDLTAKSISDDGNSPEADVALKDIDLSKYLLPYEGPTNISNESDIFDESGDKNDQREAIVDSELEEFFGFDDPMSVADVIPSPLNHEIVEETTEKRDDVEMVTGNNVEMVAGNNVEMVAGNNVEMVAGNNVEMVAGNNVEMEITSEKEPDTTDTTAMDKIINENDPNSNPEKTFAQSQEWELIDPTQDGKLPKGEDEGGPVPDPSNDEENNEVLDPPPQHDEPDEKEESDNAEQNVDEEEDDEYDTDEEIDRLVDFSSIPVKSRPIVNYVPVYRKKTFSKPKPKEDILDILKDSTSQEIDSDSSSEEEVSEEQYLLQLALTAKQQCLKDSGSDDSDDIESDSVDNEGQSIDDVTDESNDSKINTFLKKRLANEFENELKSEEKIEKSTTKEKPVDNADESKFASTDSTNAQSKNDNADHGMIDDDVHGTADDIDQTRSDDADEDEELQSSGILEPEIELHDGEKLSDKELDSDVDDNADKFEASQKPSEERKKWKLDKIAFSKNLFSNLDDLDEKQNDAHLINSDNSDCEMLDISMFKTKKPTGDLDKIIENQKKRDVSKTTKVVDECISLSSDSDLEIDKGVIDEDSEDEKPTKSRPMLRNDQLAGETKQAQKEETDRLKRLEKKTERLTQIVESQTEKFQQSNDDSDVILDFDTKRNCAISVHPEIVKNLKEHQIAGVKFMYDCCYGSVDSIDKHPGSGCILAHCMGLGKTLQLIALLHTLIRFPQLKTKKILVICPKSTIMNWADEISIWLRSVKVKLKVLQFPESSDIHKKLQILREWHLFKADPEGRAGCMLIGYEAFRSLVFYTKKPKPDISQVEMERIKKLVDEYLLRPGADLVVCDEGHVIKNRKSTTSLAVNKISSRRRIILTGTPIQNNLKEYYSMVNFIKPSFLGTEKEFANLYENPIKEGQHKDSNNQQIRIMKQRSYVLHKKLSRFVQRREAALLKTFLPEKYEYVLFIPMTELQNRLYQHFLDNNPLKEKYGGKSLIPDYTFLRKIWTHPKVLENAWKNAVALRDKRAAARRRNIDSDDEPDDVLDSQVGKMSVENDWWRQFIEPQDLRSLLPSNKLRILFEILKLCEQMGEKCLIFSAFVAVLDVVEHFMQQIHDNVQFDSETDLGLGNFQGPWQRNVDYFRLDGKTPKNVRHIMIQHFNDPTRRVKCFLISAKAGGQGINLVGASRVIILDTSWNPSNDQQNIFRVFRLGQQKKCYIYRLLAMGTMEEKVYSRSVTKQAMSFRVVDEQQIDRHYSLAELAELYTLTITDPADQPTPVRPVDDILANLLRYSKHLVYKYHEHDSLLENNSAEDLNEQEKADAWEAYEKDVSMKNQFGNMNITGDGMYSNPYGSLGMGLNMMNPYNYIPQNLPPSMIPAYLQRMGYQSGVEQELLLMSQMYSQFNQSTGSPTYNPLGAMFNSPTSSSTNPLYNSTSGNSNYFKSNIPPITTSSPSTYTNNMTTAISSNVFNGISPLSSSTSVQPSNMMYNLARYLPSYPALTGASNQASSSSSSRPTSSPLGSAFPFNLYSSPSSTSTTSNAQQTTQPGPNAIKNPLLSNLLPPSTSNTKDSFSIPTSVITKASKDQRASNTSVGNRTSPVSLSPTSMQVNRNATSNQTSQSRPSSTHSSHSGSPTITKPTTVAKGSPLMGARVSPLSSARGSPSIAARSSPAINIPQTARSSPSEARTSSLLSRAVMDTANSLSITRSSGSAHKINTNKQMQTSQLPLSITLSGNRTSPEPNIIVKDVTAINRTVERKSGTAMSSKTTSQPIKNFNMGIVYPKAQEKKSFDLSQNDPLLKAAQNQLNQLNSARSSAAAQGGRQIVTSINRPSVSKSGARTIDTNVSTTAKSHLSPNLPTNEVTITPTKRIQKLTIPSTATTLTSSTSQKPSIEINKINSALSSVSRLPASTSITRQISIPTTSGSTNMSSARIPSKPMPKLSRQVTVPTLKLISQPPQPSSSVHQNNNKTTGSARISNPVTVNSAVKNPIINRNTTNPITRVVSTNGLTKLTTQRPTQLNATDIRKVFSSNPMPKLTNFTNSSNANEIRKRKFEELIPKNTGVTLIKKPKMDTLQSDNTKRSSFVGLPVQPRKVVQQRPKGKQSAVEIVELD